MFFGGNISDCMYVFVGIETSFCLHVPIRDRAGLRNNVPLCINIAHRTQIYFRNDIFDTDPSSVFDIMAAPIERSIHSVQLGMSRYWSAVLIVAGERGIVEE